jgi:hypothetical protein
MSRQNGMDSIKMGRTSKPNFVNISPVVAILKCFSLSLYPLPSSLSHTVTHRDADKSLARPGRKQATATEDFEFHISYL